MSDDMQMLRDLGEVKAELSAVKAELAGLRERIDDVVISNLRDAGLVREALPACGGLLHVLREGALLPGTDLPLL